MSFYNIKMSDKLVDVNSDIRGEVYRESLRMNKEGIEVLKLNTGNPATFGFTMPASVKKALTENMDKAVAYCDLQGMPSAREAILDYHTKRGVKNVKMENIFITNGVSEAASMLMTALVNYNDEVLIPTPSYSLWTNTTLIAGGKPVFYKCDEKANWYPDIENIKSKITSNTKAIIIINPNNPTGAVYPEEVLREILKVAKENKLVVISDEIYDRLLMPGVSHTSVAAIADDQLVITLNGLSKSHVICGFRCGWMLISGRTEEAPMLIEGLVKQASMRLCSNALTQLVIPAALEDSASTIEMMSPGGRLYEQSKATVEAINKCETLECVKNDGAFYIFPKILRKECNIRDDRKFALDLLHEKKILIVPGSGFDYETPDHFRIVMLPQPEILANAVYEIDDFLKNYTQK